MSKIQCQFNNILLILIKQLSPYIGTGYASRFEIIIRTNAVLPIEQFLIHALPVREYIENRDTEYFNNKNFNDQDDDILCEVLKLKDIYQQIDEESKNNIWEYLQAMLILGDDYIILNKIC